MDHSSISERWNKLKIFCNLYMLRAVFTEKQAMRTGSFLFAAQSRLVLPAIWNGVNLCMLS
jgi:hypothetical protein